LKEAYEALDALYAEFPAVHCKGLCADEICGPVRMSRVEAGRVLAYGNRKPKTPRHGERLVCPALRHGRCTVYPVRPAICRLYGATESMRCPHGCEPDRMLTKEEGREYLARAFQLGV
jgi:Fe-S-cluster containining protein